MVACLVLPRGECRCFYREQVVGARRYPGFIEVRSRLVANSNTKRFVRVLSPFFGIMGVPLPLLAGFDARFGWSGFEFSQAISITAAILFAAGHTFVGWEIVSNRFFSGVVRIQTDRDHTVVSSGPYHIVRHPGYLGWIVT